MKSIDASPKGIFDISWSPDGKWISYVSGEDGVRLANAGTGDIRIIGPGVSPAMTADLRVVIERSGEIVLVSGAGEQLLVTGNQIAKATPKRAPLLSPDGKTLLFVVCNLFDKGSQAKNAYPYRHFLALTPLDRFRPILTAEQWYGGCASFFPDGSRFAHFEYDSTAGPQIHVVNLKGEREGSLPGTYPAISPDGSRLAAVPRGGGSLMVYASKGGWSDDAVELTVVKIPDEGQAGMSANPPIWLDNRLALFDAGGRLLRVDTRRDKVEEMKKLPIPTQRRKCSMVASPARDQIAVEVAVEDRFELRVVPL